MSDWSLLSIFSQSTKKNCAHLHIQFIYCRRFSLHSLENVYSANEMNRENKCISKKTIKVLTYLIEERKKKYARLN